VFGEGEPRTRFYTVAVTPDGRWLTITATTGTDPSKDVWLADLTTSPPHRPDLRPVQQGVAARTELRIAPGTGPGDPMFLRTTRDAPLGRLMTVRADALDAPWRELVPERPGAVLADFALLSGKALTRPLVLVSWITGAVGEITVHDLRDGAQVANEPLPGTGTVGNLIIRPDGGHEGWFSYTDHRTAPVVLRYDALAGQTDTWPAEATASWPAEARAADGVPGVRVRRDSFPAADGTLVPIFVLSPDDRPGSPRPALLTGYGGFGVSMTPAYTPHAVAWVQAGGVYAIACLRGGGEYGRAWHEDGRRAVKQHVFDDFCACARWLADSQWSRTELIAITGGSNGGLLVGACLTQHPELFGACVAYVGVFDMLRFHKFTIGWAWTGELGNPDDPTEYQWLRAYSPLHNVTSGTRYPATLLLTGDHDDRVVPGHSFKFAATLQAAQGGEQPVLIRVDTAAGHGAGKPTDKSIATDTDVLTFLAGVFGSAAAVPSQ
jgi:prolyl oligopeptidase